MKFNSPAFLFILPVAFFWFVADGTLGVVLVSVLAMALAESLRQYLALSFVREPESPKSLFFFGVIYKDSRPFFESSRKSPPQISRGKKILMLLGIYLLTMAVRYSPPFSDVEMIPMAFFSFILTLWINCKTYRSLSRVLTLQLLFGCVYFALQQDASAAVFTLWLLLSLWTQYQLHRWQLGSENSLTLSGFPKAVAMALVLFLCFNAADFVVPQYAEVENGGSTLKIKSPAALPKKFLQKMAKMKLQAGSVDIKKLASSKNEMPNFNLSSKPSTLQFGENQQGLEDIKMSLAQSKPVASSQLEKLRGLSKAINSPSKSGGPSNSNADPEDKMIEDRIEKLKSLQPEKPESQQKPGEDDVDAYIRSRQELSQEVDKLIAKDQLQTLAREELNLQRIFDRALDFLKRFSFLIALFALAAYVLTRKKSRPSAESGEEATDFSLPKEVRLRLRTLYRMLQSGKHSARDEVLKSFYIVELAFKEIEFGRDEALPPQNFLEKLASDLPFVYNSAKIPIELFNRVFYGDKNPDERQIKDLRTSMKTLMKKLRVI